MEQDLVLQREVENLLMVLEGRYQKEEIELARKVKIASTKRDQILKQQKKSWSPWGFIHFKHWQRRTWTVHGKWDECKMTLDNILKARQELSQGNFEPARWVILSEWIDTESILYRSTMAARPEISQDIIYPDTDLEKREFSRILNRLGVMVG